MQGFEHRDYDVSGTLGQGGHAVVYKARHRTLDRWVAIKVLREDADPGLVRRLIREAQLIARLQHRNLVQVFDAGALDNGVHYIVMEYVDGGTLGDLMRTRRVSLVEALSIVYQVSSGLMMAHEAGVVHRDIKPANILMGSHTETGQGLQCPKLADFGVARPENSNETQVGAVIGTPAYMAPEAFDGQVVPATDVYALGVVLFQLVTGEYTLRGPKILTWIRGQLEGDGGVAPRAGDAPQAVLQLIRDMVELDADGRLKDAGAVVAALDALRPWSAQAQAQAQASQDELAQETLVETGTSHPRRNLIAAVAGVVGAVAVVGIGAAVWLGMEQALTPVVEVVPERAVPDAAPSDPDPTPGDPAPSGEPSAAVDAEADPSPKAPSKDAAEPPRAGGGASDAASGGGQPTPPRGGEDTPAPASEGAPAEPEAEATPPEAEAPPTADAAPEAEAAEPEPAPDPPEAASPALAGRYRTSLKGRPLIMEISGGPSALRMTATLSVGERSEHHDLTGTATAQGGGWALQLNEAGGTWAIRGTLADGQFSGGLSIKGRDKGRFVATREGS